MVSAIVEGIACAITDILLYGTGYVILSLFGVKALHKKDSLCGIVGFLFWAISIVLGYFLVKELLMT